MNGTIELVIAEENEFGRQKLYNFLNFRHWYISSKRIDSTTGATKYVLRPNDWGESKPQWDQNAGRVLAQTSDRISVIMKPRSEEANVALLRFLDRYNYKVESVVPDTTYNSYVIYILRKE
jgi:hypothetical protein